jgi:hypothetical protein
LPLPEGWDLAVSGLSNKTMTQNIPQDPHRNGSVTKKIFVLSWPSQSPDLWADLKRAVDKRKHKKVKDLERICMDE